MNTENMRQHFEADGSPARIDGGTAVVVPSSEWLGSVVCHALASMTCVDVGHYNERTGAAGSTRDHYIATCTCGARFKSRWTWDRIPSLPNNQLRNAGGGDPAQTL